MTIELRLSAIYQAAHVDIPGQAQALSEHGSTIAEHASGASAELAKIGHPLSGDYAALGEEVLVKLRRIVGTMNDCSTALDRIADDFASEDEQAAAWFREHGSWLDRNDYDGRPEPTPIPTGPGAE